MSSLATILSGSNDAHATRAGAGPRFSHTALLMASQMSKWSLRLVFVAVIARAMGPEKFGAYAMIFAMSEFLAVASGAGYADYLTREAAKDERSGWGLALQLMLLRISVAVPLAAIEIGGLALLHYPHAVRTGTAWMALTMLPRSLSEAVQGVLRGIHRLGSFLVIELTLGTGLVVGAFVLFLQHGGLNMAIWTEVVAAAAAGVAGLGFLLKFKTREQSWLSGWQLVKRGSVFNVYSFVVNVYDRFDVVLLSKLVGDYATGVYALAYRGLVMTQIVPTGVLYSLLPTLSRNPRSTEERARLERAMGLLLSAAFVVVLATMGFAGAAVRFLFGPLYAETALALKILIWAVILRYANCALNFALLAAGRERVFILTSLVCLAVNFVGNLIFIPIYSWHAAAIFTIITEAVLFGQNLYWIRRTVGTLGLPLSTIGTALTFLALLIMVGVGGHLMSLPVTGAACLFLFISYLFWSGRTAEFAMVWRRGRDPVI